MVMDGSVPNEDPLACDSSCACSKQLSDLLNRVAKLEAALSSDDSSPRKKGKTSQEAAKSVAPRETDAVGCIANPTEIPMSSTRMLLQQMCSPRDCDVLGRCYGGTVLSWIDLAAAYSAARVAGGPVVTASVDAVYFLRPLNVNSIAVLEATVNCTFSSSMEVGVRVFEEHPTSGTRVETCSALLTFVSLNSLKRPDTQYPKLLPRLVAEGSKQEQVMSDAAARRERRLAKRKAAAGKESVSLPPTGYRNITVPDTSILRSVSSSDPSADMKITSSETMSHLVQFVMPHHVNPGGITFGGQVLAWVEEAAYLSAVRLNLKGHMVTASMDAVSFKEPTTVGAILYFTSEVTAVFNSSVEVMVSVFAEHVMHGAPNTKFVMDAFVTMVSVDDRGAAQPMHVTLEASTDVEHRRMEEAQQRREERLQMLRDILAVQHDASAATHATP